MFSPPKPLEPSPVSVAFPLIKDCPLDQLRLSSCEQSILKKAEENPIDYTLAIQKDATDYVHVLLKVLGEASIRLESSKVSQFIEKDLVEDEALDLIRTDPMGVMSHYSLTCLHDVIISLLEKKPGSSINLTTTFFQPFDGCLIDNYRPLMRVLHLGGNGDSFAQRTASLCLSYLLLAGCPSQIHRQKPLFWINSATIEEPLQGLVSWLISQLQSSSAASLRLVSPTLSLLATSPEARDLFHRRGGIVHIAKHLKIGLYSNNLRTRMSSAGFANMQQIYELCFFVWTLTYELNSSTALRDHFARSGIVSALVGLLGSAPREKIIRLTVSALRNLANCSADASSQNSQRVVDGPFFLSDMISCGILKSMESIKDRQWTDPDVLEDLEILSNLLNENYKSMSRWDIYKAEVDSGQLEWGAVHTEIFFRENATKMEGSDGNFGYLKKLIFLASCDNEEVAAIACFDIGEFVCHYPNGRSIAKRLGAKQVMMQLIQHENVDLKQQALMAVSKILVKSWDMVK